MPPVIFLGLGALALFFFFGAREAHAAVQRLPSAPPEPVSPEAQRPFTDLPDDVAGTPVRRTVTAQSGNVYAVDLYPPNDDDQTFAVAQLSEWAGGGAMNVQPYVNWIRYYQDRQTGEREADRRFAHTGNPAHDELVVAVMESDFGL